MKSKHSETPIKPIGSMPKNCFSYIRFSSSKQFGNSSVERQSPIAKRVADEHGWTYRKEWNARDLGVSAFKGDNVTTIEAIIQSVKDGKIPQGSVLILESLDRATRLELDPAQQLIRSILKCGLEIYTDMNKRHLTAKSLSNVTDVMLTAVELDAAFQYAHRQHERATKGIDKQVRAIEKGERVYIGGQMPSYIRGVENGKFIIDDERLKVVRHIFSEYMRGTTMYRIAIQLNEGVKSGKFVAGLKRKSANKWDRQTIKHILTNAAYTGDYSLRGVTYENYLPVQVVSHKDFKLVQDKIKLNTARRGGSGTGNVNSIFNGTGKCSKCGSPMAAIISTDNGKRYNYYGCSSARYGKCAAKGWLKTHDCEEYFILEFLNETPFGLINKNSPKVKDNTLAIKARIADVESAIDNTIEMIDGKMTAATKDKLKLKISTLENEKAEFENELQIMSVKLLAANNAPAILANIKSALEVMDNVEDFAEVQKTLRDNEVRKKLKALIPMLVKEVRFDAHKGGFTVMTHDGKESEWVQVAYAKEKK